MKHFKVFVFVFIMLLFIAGCQDAPQIQFETNGGNKISNLDLKDVDNLELPIPEKVGYTFDGWFFDVELTEPFSLDNLSNQSVKVYAKWQVKMFSITFDVHGGEDIQTLNIDFNELLDLPEPEKSGYTFAGWYLDASYNNLFDEERMLDEDLMLHAKWTLTTFTVSFVTNSDDTIDSMSYTINDDFDDVIPEKEDLNFLGWYLDEMLTIPFSTDELSGDSFTLFAKWSMSYEEMYEKIMQSDNYTLTLDNEPFGSIIVEVDGTKVTAQMGSYKEYIYVDEITETIYSLTPSQSDLGCYEKHVFSVFANIEEVIDLYAWYKNLLPQTYQMDYVSDEGIMFVPNTYLEMLNETVFYDELGTEASSFGLVFNDNQLTYTLGISNLNTYITATFSFIDETEIIIPETMICEDNTYVQGITADRIYIGNTVTTSGAFASVGLPYFDGMNAYIQYINSQGGIQGRYLELIYYDDEFDATMGLYYTKKLVEENEVFAIVGQLGSPTIYASMEYLNEAGIPTVYLGSSLYGMHIEMNDNIFPVQPTSSEGVQLLRRIKIENIYGTNFDQPLGSSGHIGVIYEENYQDVVTEIHQEAGQHSLNVTSKQISINNLVVQAAVRDLVSEGVDVVIILTQNQTRYVLQAMQSENLHVPAFLGYQSTSITHIDTSLSYSFPILGHYYLDIYSDKGSIEFTRYAYVMENYGDVNNIYNAFAIAGYQAMYMFVEGLLRIGDEEITWQSFIDAMEQSPLNIPMGGFVEYIEGIRTGTNAFGLQKYNPSTKQFENYRDIEQL
ncbi:MAG: hypothetical protein EP317_06470 [Bacillota bacterium]|nr:MAG: hypothetical protein EP317_06470 [Bacillota bacterium]